MATVTTNNKHYSDIAAVMRANGPYYKENFRPSEMAEKLQHTVNFAHSRGVNDGYTDGVSAGQKTEYDRFWDVYQQKGQRTDYDSAFRGVGWNGDSFYPKYDIIVSKANNCFTNFDGKINLSERLSQCGVELDVSKAGSLVQFFMGSNFTHVPHLVAPNCNNIGFICGSCYYLTNFSLTTDTELTSTANSFNQCTSLTDVELNCKLAASINFQWSPLTRQSIESVMAALSENTHDLTATFQKTAVEAAFTTQEWNDLTATRTNWNIALV